MMRKTIFAVFLLFLLMMTVSSAIGTTKDKLIKTQFYINDVLQNTFLYDDPEENYLDKSDTFAPLRAIVEMTGAEVRWVAPNVIYIINASRHNIFMKLNGETLEYCYFWDDAIPDSQSAVKAHRVPCRYLNLDGSIYIPLSEMKLLANYVINFDQNEIKFYSKEYYKTKCLYSKIGRQYRMDLYINDIKIESNPFWNTSDDHQFNCYYDFVPVRPVFEAIGATVSFEPPNKIKVIYKDKPIEFQIETIVDTKNNANAKYTEGIEDSYLIDGVTYLPFYVFRKLTGGSLKQKDVNSMYIYTDDYHRKDIPNNLKEAYEYFDANLSEKDIQYIRNCSEDDLSLLHMSLGLWIRNNWIYPSKDHIAKGFLERGINLPDNISSCIIWGYYRHLNGLPADLDDLIGEESDSSS